MDSREQLLNTLMQDLQAFSLPERYSEEKKAQVMKGRKGQADIDAGRRTIADNESQYQDALRRRGDLQGRIAELQGQIDQGAAKAAAESPYEQGRQIALFGAPAAGGTAGGYLKGNSLSKALREKAAERSGRIAELAGSVRSGEIPQESAARTARKLRLTGRTRHGIGPLLFGAGLAAGGAAQRAYAPDLTDNPIGQDVIRGFGGLESGVGTGLVAQQIGSMMGGVKQPSARDIATIDNPSPAGPSPAATPDPSPAKPPPKPGTRAALYTEAKARNLPVTSRMKKAEIESVMSKALRAAGKRAKDAPKAILPIAAGLGVYDAMRTPAQAEDGQAAAEPASRGAAAAAGGAAAAGTVGLAAGGRAIGERMMQVPALATALRGLGRVVGPAAGALTAYDAGSAVLGGLRQGEDVQGADRALRQGNPSFFAGQEALQRQAYGEEPAAPTEADLQPLVAASADDPELAEMLRQLILERAQGADAEPIPAALASQAVAQQGADPMASALRNLAMR